MDIVIDLLKAFVIGGCICLVGQILIDVTKLTPGRILVAFVVIGVVLTAVGVYEPLVEWAGAGATVPLTGFGFRLAEGVKQEVDKIGFLGIFMGAIKAASAGITAAVFFAFLAALFAEPKEK